MTLTRIGIGTPLALLVCAAVPAGCVDGSPQEPAATHAVAVRLVDYDPERLEVAVGDTVVWTNEDALPHTVTSADTAWGSGDMPRGSSWTYVAAAAGEYPYVCEYHPTMRGVLVVR